MLVFQQLTDVRKLILLTTHRRNNCINGVCVFLHFVLNVTQCFQALFHTPTDNVLRHVNRLFNYAKIITRLVFELANTGNNVVRRSVNITQSSADIRQLGGNVLLNLHYILAQVIDFVDLGYNVSTHFF